MNGRVSLIPNVLVDCGSGTTMFAVDRLREIGINPSPDDVLQTVTGVGGVEHVFSRTLDYVRIGEFALHDFEVNPRAMRLQVIPTSR